MLFPLRDFRRLLGVLVMLLMVGSLSAGVTTYKVKSGDTLYRIALAHKTSVSALKSLNGIKDERKLQVGQILKLSASSRSGSSSSSSKSAPYARVGVGKRIVIDPGHGGRDKGAIWGGVRESDLNMKVCRELETILKGRGYSTVMTRRSDTFVSLTQRAAIANRYRNAIFVSVHFNATRETWVKGAETYYAGAAGRSLATAIHGEMLRRLELRNRGVRLARFTVLMQTRCPAVLVECGYISNSKERRRCATTSYCQTAAMAIAEGIRKYRWR